MRFESSDAALRHALRLIERTDVDAGSFRDIVRDLGKKLPAISISVVNSASAAAIGRSGRPSWGIEQAQLYELRALVEEVDRIKQPSRKAVATP